MTFDGAVGRMAALCNFSELQKHDRFVSPSGSPSCEGKLVLRRANRRLSFSLRREERVSGLRAPCGDLPGLPILPGTLAKVVQGSSDRRQAALSSARRLFPEPTSAPEVGARGLPVVSSHRLPGLPSVREPRARPGRRCSQRGVQSVSVRRAAKVSGPRVCTCLHVGVSVSSRGLRGLNSRLLCTQD